nr:ribbon-helix-helix protein, CopG family [uncultured Oscillibacter sp.]
MERKRVQPTSIRLSEDLYNKIKEDAEQEKRSMTGQIEYMLLQYYELKKLFK